MAGRANPMKKRMSAPTFQAVFAAIYLIADIIFSGATFAAAYHLRFSIFSPNVSEPNRESYLAVGVLFILLNIYFFKISGLYRPMRGSSRLDIIFQVVKSTSISLVILLALTFFYRDIEYSRLTIIYAILIAYVALSFGRMAVLSFERFLLMRGHGRKRVAIVGTGPNFLNTASRFLTRADLGYELIGYLEEKAKGLAQIPLLGTLDEIEEIIITRGIDVIIVTLEPEYHARMKELVDLCDRRGVECMLVPDMIELLVGPRFYEEICGVPLIRVKGLRIKGFNAFIKRSMDLVLSFLSMVFLFPFLFLISVIIKVSSPGPIFYMQKRVGMDGNIFWMYKFRTMRTDAEAEKGPAWSMNEDPRVTGIGRILRKTSLDELPQIINVFTGEMSLIGPRPERPFFVEKFEKGIPRYMERHKVKSGMSGWAQVNGLRGDTSIPDRLQYDLYYIENWSLWFDIKIIILTILDIISNFLPERFKRHVAVPDSGRLQADFSSDNGKSEKTDNLK